MARGWESKSVEAQQAEAADKAAGSRPRMRPEDAARWREKEKFRLARQSVLQQLQANQNPRYRQLLQDALADLDRKLSQLELSRLDLRIADFDLHPERVAPQFESYPCRRHFEVPRFLVDPRLQIRSPAPSR